MQSLYVVTQAPAPKQLADLCNFTSITVAGGAGEPLTVAGAHVQGQSASELALIKRTCADMMTRQVAVGYRTMARVQAVFFDMDATLIHEESLVELAAFAGVQRQVHEITERAMAGELDFKAALRERVALLRGLDAQSLTILAGRLTLMPGIKELVSKCRESGVKTFMVSGGFVELAKNIAADVGLDGFHANSFAMRDGKLTGEVLGSIVDAQGKEAYVLSTCAKYGIDPAAVVAVGDGANDLPMLRRVGMAVGHRPKEVLWPHLHAANWLGDHRLLIPLLFGFG